MIASRLQDHAFRNILFCTDFSENADFAFEYALDIARRRPEATLHLLHVIPEPEAQFWRTYLYEIENVDTRAETDMQTKIDNTYRSRVPVEVQLETTTRIGKADAEILKYAEEIDADLIVIGRQGKSSWGTLLFGDITERVARHADCAVMIIPYSYEKKLEHEDEEQ
ncbi:MAG: universal stress protein [Candidatus Sumerlaeia bacterium]